MEIYENSRKISIERPEEGKTGTPYRAYDNSRRNSSVSTNNRQYMGNSNNVSE